MVNDGKPVGNAAQQNVRAQVKAGVEGAAPALTSGSARRIDRLRVRVPRGASASEISQAIATAARKTEGRTR